MHNEPQISCRGEWGDASIMEDNKGRINYYCKYCNYKCRSRETIVSHINICKDKISNLEYGVDYVLCKICNQHGRALGQHILLYHNISINDYKKIYGEIICEITSNKFADLNKNRENWRTKAVEKGLDLEKFNKKMGEKVSQNIMANPDERERRSKLMKLIVSEQLLNPEFYKHLSEIAKKTSSRPEILEQRTNNLRNWRNNNPEEFKEKCTDKMLAATPKKPTWFSKPEKMLYQFLKTFVEFNFRFNQVLKSKTFNWPSHRKQIDMADKKNRIYVEYDGPTHFNSWGNEPKFQEVKRRDALVNKYIMKNELMMIRISYDQFVDRKKTSRFRDECIKELIKLLNNFQVGVFTIGEKYGKH